MGLNKRGVSYAISAVIATATIVVLVLVAGTYTYQVLDQQRGAAEFDVIQKSFLAFNDALENTAWKSQGSRSARFSITYGTLELLPGIPFIVSVPTYDNVAYNATTGIIRYSLSTSYVSFGANYSQYILGADHLVSNGTGSYGRALIEQGTGVVTTTLTYGVRAMKTSVLNVTDGNSTKRVAYVDIWIIQVDIDEWSAHIHDFDLNARSLNVQTYPSAVYNITEENRQCNVTVRLGDEMDSTTIGLGDDADNVVFNFIIATVKVNV
jgi:hypothetical protein